MHFIDIQTVERQRFQNTKGEIFPTSHFILHIMKAYEFPSKLNAQGNLEIPEAVLKHLSTEQEIKIIVLVSEPSESSEQPEAENSLGFSSASFQESWRQANNGQTLPLSQLWEGIDVD